MLVFYYLLGWYFSKPHDLKDELRSTYHEQLDLALEIQKQSAEGALFSYWGWFQAPELSFLSEIEFYDLQNPKTRDWLTKKVLHGNTVYIIVSDIQKGMAIQTFEEEKQYLGQQTMRNAGFDVYLMAPLDLASPEFFP